VLHGLPLKGLVIAFVFPGDVIMMAMQVKHRQGRSAISDHSHRFNFPNTNSVTSLRADSKSKDLAAAKKSRWSAEGKGASNTLIFSLSPYNGSQRQRARLSWSRHQSLR
jgi:hypothetical protein